MMKQLHIYVGGTAFLLQKCTNGTMPQGPRERTLMLNKDADVHQASPWPQWSPLKPCRFMLHTHWAML